METFGAADALCPLQHPLGCCFHRYHGCKVMELGLNLRLRTIVKIAIAIQISKEDINNSYFS